MLPSDLDKKFYTIGEVAEILGLPTSTIRFYERETGIGKPQRSGTGRRMYRPQEIETLKMLLFLVRDRGMRLQAAREEIRRNPDGVLRHAQAVERLRQVRDHLQQTIDALHKLR